MYSIQQLCLLDFFLRKPSNYAGLEIRCGDLIITSLLKTQRLPHYLQLDDAIQRY